jgi:hypothetical protein
MLTLVRSNVKVSRTQWQGAASKVKESIATIGCTLTISVSLAQMFPGPQHRRC